MSDNPSNTPDKRTTTDHDDERAEKERTDAAQRTTERNEQAEKDAGKQQNR